MRTTRPTLTPLTYRTRPEETDALYFDPMHPVETGRALAAWCGGEFQEVAKPGDPSDVAYTVVVPALPRPLTIHRGDYLLRDRLTGRFTVMPDKAFEQKFHPAQAVTR